jgi:hypothetical protein
MINISTIEELIKMEDEKTFSSSTLKKGDYVQYIYTSSYDLTKNKIYKIIDVFPSLCGNYDTIKIRSDNGIIYGYVPYKAHFRKVNRLSNKIKTLKELMR